MVAYPDTLVGTDSHTTMVNGLGVLGWGVGGIEAEAAMLGQPVSMLIPEVVGFRLSGELKEGITATDLVLTVTQMLRAKGVVGRFVEFYGPGLDSMSVADRATIANMAPEYGATCGFFPIDDRTLEYMRLTGRDGRATSSWSRAYCQAQGLWRDALGARAGVHRHARARHEHDRAVARRAEAAAGPGAAERGRRPVQRRAGADLQEAQRPAGRGRGRELRRRQWRRRHRRDHQLHQHLEPVGAGRRRAGGAEGARRRGCEPSRGSRPASRRGARWSPTISKASGLSEDLDALGFDLVGYGCTTCIGNSGPLAEPISKAINDNDLVAVSVLSGNRNFEGRVSPDCRANYLASPPLVVAYALKGTVRADLVNEPIGTASNGEPVFLKDIWPSNEEIRALIDAHVHSDMFRRRYADVYHGDERWRAIEVDRRRHLQLAAGIDLHPEPALLHRHDDEPVPPGDIDRARPLAMFGDSITTDHISPAGAIKPDSPAGRYLLENGVAARRVQQLRRAPRQP